MNILTALARANRSILAQKFGLMEALVAKHGYVGAEELYSKTCPIVKATIGQHFRHSMDHIEPAVLAAAGKVPSEIHYDRRQRGGTEESNWEVASERIRHLDELLEELTVTPDSQSVVERPLQVCFMLSGDSEEEYMLHSSAARELGFAAHHAIHHMAMVRVIAECNHVGRLRSDELPSDFGRAPSTLNFDRQNRKTT